MNEDNLTPLQLRDLEVMDQQDKVYNIIKTFLESDLAKEFKITGLSARKEGKYVNLEWKFGNEE